MAKDGQARIYRSDYAPPVFLIDTVDLDVALDPKATVVLSTMRLRRNQGNEGTSASSKGNTLKLHGEDLTLHEVQLDGEVLPASRYQVDERGLTITDVPDAFELRTKVTIAPASNTQLMGLFQSKGTFCTQCEAEGFRRITYYLDRPDVMATFTTRIEADKKACPVLLSNGNRVGVGDLPNGRHWVKWDDPFRKPSYLFALVGGQLVCHRGAFTTKSGRDVVLEIWVEPANADKCEHALESLKRAMKWDEDTFGLEYDLDIYMIVAVDDFNMGAMENKGLNVFNSKFVLAKPETATDDDYDGVESVVAHEYFHNWTGNRVTCRDWFQLTLKEGLTVFRDQEFSSDTNSRSVQRIRDVLRLRSVQFAEDAGPLAHPIRPESYVEMNNFYTATVYEKGAEVVRMLQTRFGREGFKRGLQLYLSRHDGTAATCDDFRHAIGEANETDLNEYEHWYQQAGTPRVTVTTSWDASARRFELTLAQVIESGEKEQPSEQPPLPMPIRVALIDADGNDIDGTARTLWFEQREQTFVFEDVAVGAGANAVAGTATRAAGESAEPMLSIGRGFSAPVRFLFERADEQLAFLLRNDNDEFNRWEAGQELMTRAIVGLVKSNDVEGEVNPMLIEACEAVLNDESLDGSIKSLMLTLPSEKLIEQLLADVDPVRVFEARRHVVRTLANTLVEGWQAAYNKLQDGNDAVTPKEVHRRRMKNRALSYLVATERAEFVQLAAEQLKSARVMTDAEAALACLVEVSSTERDEALQWFYNKWSHEPLVVDKWFRLQAMASTDDAFDRVCNLASHNAFVLSNPNRARSLLFAFAAGNTRHFHAIDGAGYAFVADYVLRLDAINPQVAARLAGVLNGWRRYEPIRQKAMRTALKHILNSAKSNDVREIVESAL